MTPSELRSLRRALPLTQGELAAILGVSRATINRWERGREPIPKWLTLAMDRLAWLVIAGEMVAE